MTGRRLGRTALRKPTARRSRAGRSVVLTAFDLSLLKDVSGWGFIINPSDRAVRRAFKLDKAGFLHSVYVSDEKLHGELTKKGLWWAKYGEV